MLLLEAGPKGKTLWIGVPLGFPMLFTNKRNNWCFETDSDPAMNNRRHYAARKVLGGSSAIKDMVYMRGNRADYALWRQQGCTGWGHEDVLPYFKRVDDQQRGPDEYHGVGGPVAITDPHVRSAIADAVIAAAGQAGIPRTADFNGSRRGPLFSDHDKVEAALEQRASLSPPGSRART